MRAVLSLTGVDFDDLYKRAAVYVEKIFWLTFYKSLSYKNFLKKSVPWCHPFLGSLLLRPDRDAGRSAGDSTTVLESYKDPVRGRIKGNVAVALHEDSKGRCCVGVDLRGHTSINGRDALTASRIGLTQNNTHR